MIYTNQKYKRYRAVLLFLLRRQGDSSEYDRLEEINDQNQVR